MFVNSARDLSQLRIAYAPMAADFRPPGDRRRFAFWAVKRGVQLELADISADYDLVVLSERADISTWSRLAPSRTRLVYDLTDSYLAIPPGSLQDLARGTGKSLLRQHRRWTWSYSRAVVAMCRRADVVICSTPEQRRAILEHCSDVRVILDVHDHELAPAQGTSEAADGTLRLFWEGQPQNLRGFRPVFNEALRLVANQMPVELHLATDPTFPRWFGRVGRVRTEDLVNDLAVKPHIHEWNSASLPAIAASCDVGVIPLDLDNAFAAGKPENKLLLMWHLGLPTVTSATPAYCRVMTQAHVNLTCETSEQWATALVNLATDAPARSAAIAAGKAYVDKHHSTEVILAAWDGLVEDLLTQVDSG